MKFSGLPQNLFCGEIEMPPRNPPFAHAEDTHSYTPAPRLPQGLLGLQTELAGLVWG